MNYVSLLIAFFVISMIAIPLPAFCDATISTDKADYGPEETVVISGSGFLANAQVTITITAPDSSVATVYATTDDSGAFTAQYTLNGMEGTYAIIATDGISSASTTFTESLSISWVKSSGSSYPPEKDSFSTAENVYAVIQAFGWGSKSVRIYVVANEKWDSSDDGKFLTDVSGGYETVTVYGGQNGPFLIWPATTTAGSYDIIVDEDKDGKFDYNWWCKEEVDDDGTSPGFTVAAPPTYSVTFDAAASPGLPDVADDTVIISGSIGAMAFTVTNIELPKIFTGIAPSTTITYTFTDPVPCTVSGKRYRLDSITGPASPFQIAGDTTITGNYVVQYELTLDTNPPGVTTPTGAGWYDENTEADISTDEYVDIVPDESRYRFDGWTTGDMTEIDDPSATSTTVFMDKVKTVTANYVTQYYITFDQTGVGSDFTGTVATIDTTGYGVSGLPVSFWWDENSEHSFAFQSPLVVTPNAKQFVWTSTTGLSSAQSDPTFEVTTSGSIIGNYKTQYYLTVKTRPEGLVPAPTPPSGWFDEYETVSLWASQFATKDTRTYAFAYWKINGNLVYSLSATVYMDAPKTAVANYFPDPIGDVNLDGMVDLQDLHMICHHYGTRKGDAKYNPLCDINDDGQIDLIDLATAARNLKK